MVIEQLGSRHDRNTFDCGNGVLNQFLATEAGQYLSRGMGVTYVAVESPANGRVLGFYTLAASNLVPGVLPIKRLPTRLNIPVLLLGRLAVDVTRRGTGLGARLLMDALRRSLKVSEEVGAAAVVVDAIDDRAVRFYTQYGFKELLDDPRHVFISMKEIRALGLAP